MSACSSQFITKNCQCLADPMNPWATICGYTDVNNGLVYPCELGCCVPACAGVGHQPPGAVQFTKSDGNRLPPGYGVNLPQSDTPNLPQGATVFGTPTASYTGPQNTAQTTASQSAVGLKVWQVVMMLFIILSVILVSSFLA